MSCTPHATGVPRKTELVWLGDHGDLCFDVELVSIVPGEAAK